MLGNVAWRAINWRSCRVSHAGSDRRNRRRRARSSARVRARYTRVRHSIISAKDHAARGHPASARRRSRPPRLPQIRRAYKTTIGVDCLLTISNRPGARDRSSAPRVVGHRGDSLEHETVYLAGAFGRHHRRRWSRPGTLVKMTTRPTVFAEHFSRPSGRHDRQ